MPKNATILMVRHAEKPDAGQGLAVAGQERAQAYVAYFPNYPLDGQPVKLDFLFAAADSDESHRPRLTITPLAAALGLTINDKHKDKHYQEVVDDLNAKGKYDNANVLVCWHHGQILDFAAALGASAATLPPASNWPPPKSWPLAVYGWLLQIRYDADGHVIPAETVCVNQKLMFDDTVDPPGPGVPVADE